LADQIANELALGLDLREGRREEGGREGGEKGQLCVIVAWDFSQKGGREKGREGRREGRRASRKERGGEVEREGGQAYLGGDLVLGGLVAAGGDDGGVGLEPGELEDGLAAGGLGEENVGGTHGFFGGGTDLRREEQKLISLI